MNLERRLRMIATLLATRHDHLPGIRGARLERAAGFQHGRRWESCPDCALNGFVSRNCSSCEGKGQIPCENQRDPYARNEGVAGREQVDRRDSQHEIDRKIESLKQSERQREGLEAIGDTYTNAVGRLERSQARGSYLELERALAKLREKAPAEYATLNNADAKQLVDDPAEYQQALQALAAYMPAEIRAPGQILEQAAAQERRLTIREHLEAGWKPGRISAELGIPLRKIKFVKRTIAREAAQDTMPLGAQRSAAEPQGGPG